MSDKNLVKVTRCINCCSFIPIDKMILCGFKENFIQTGKLVKADGFCDNINLWVKESDYCSQAAPKDIK